MTKEQIDQIVQQEQYIDKDDLTEVARLLECGEVIMCDILLDYFEAYDMSKPEDRQSVCYDFHRYRLYMATCFDGIHKAIKELHDKGIYCYK